MPRGINDLTPEQQQALRIHQERLRDRTRTRDEHAEASAAIQRLLHTGLWGDFYEALEAFEAQLVEIKEGKTAEGVGRVAKELREFKESIEQRLEGYDVALKNFAEMYQHCQEETGKLVQVIDDIIGDDDEEPVELVDVQGLLEAQNQKIAGLQLQLEDTQSGAGALSGEELSQFIKDEVDRQARQAVQAAVGEVLGEDEAALAEAEEDAEFDEELIEDDEEDTDV